MSGEKLNEAVCGKIVDWEELGIPTPKNSMLLALVRDRISKHLD